MSNLVIAAVRTILTQSTAVTTLVPSSRITSAYRLDVGSLPAIVLAVQSDIALSPSLDRQDQVRKCSIDIECIAGNLGDSRTIGEAVRVSMHGAKGMANSTTIQEIRENGITSTYDIGAEGTETGIHITVVTVDAYYASAAVNPTSIT